MSFQPKQILAAVAVLTALPVAAEAGGPFTIDVQFDVPIANLPQINPEIRIELTAACPDPAAVAIQASVVAAAPDLSWADVALTGVVRNNGGAYASGANQQVALLQTTAGATLGQANFPILAPGQSVNIGSTIRVASGDEFLPDVQLQISYDPDIFIDGNTANDDCRMGNNQTVLTAAQLASVAFGG